MFDKMKSILKNSAEKALDIAEVKVNPDLRGMNALAASFALLIMADRVVEEEEMEAVSEYLIDRVPLVVEKGLIREVSELFLKQVERLEKGYNESAFEGNIVSGEVLKDIALIKDDKDYCKLVADTVTLVTSGDSVDEGEVKTRDRILKALGKA